VRHYFERLGNDRFRPTDHVAGAWDPNEQHISPMNGLVVHGVDQFVRDRGGPDEKVLARMSIDILGVLPMDEFTLRVESIRPGRTIELLEATVIAAGRPAVRTRIWRLQTYDTAGVAGGEAPKLPPPIGVDRLPLSDIWPGGYIRSVDVRALQPPQPGRVAAWVTTDVDLLDDEPASDVARFVGLIDTMNGIAVRESIDEWMFPNVEMSVHFHRVPVGREVGFDTTVVFGPHGAGTTTSLLHDREGHVGSAVQQLTVRARS
jgi:hypothetical protein